MRVLQVNTGWEEDSGFFVDLVGALAAAGLPQSAALGRRSGAAAPLDRAGVRTFELPFGGFWDVMSGARLRDHARRWRAEFVCGWTPRACARLPRGPWVPLGYLGAAHDLRHYRRCRHLVCPTPDLADHAVRNGVPPGRVHHIPVFSTVRPEPALHPDLIRTPEGVPILLLVAPLRADLGLDAVLRALVLVPDAVLWIVGRGPAAPTLRRLARDLGLERRVRFLGVRSDRSALLKAASAVVVPHRADPAGATVVAAWAHGVPVVALEADEGAPLVRDGEDGVVVRGGPAPLAAALRLVLDNLGLARHFAAEGLMRAAADFTAAQAITRYFEVFAAVRP